MDTKFHLLLSITLEPRISSEAPAIVLIFNNQTIFDGLLEKTNTFTIDQMLPGTEHLLELNFHNKNNHDTTETSDKAVIIKSITFNNITDDHFIWTGEYEPVYPEPWYSSQTIKPDTVLHNQTYLGWNGTWRLKFTTPIFTWIHHLKNLGWIYN